jgi:hypothetical protein
MRALLFAAAIAAASLSANADSSACLGLLTPDVTSMTENDVVRLAYLQTWDNATYTTRRRNNSLGASLPVNGVPVSATANFQDFKSKLATEQGSRNFTLDTDKSSALLVTKLPVERAKLFNECMSINKSYLKLNVESTQAANGTLLVHVLWDNEYPKEDITVDFSASTLTNVANPEVLPKTLKANQRQLFRVTLRDVHTPVELAAQANGKTAVASYVPEPVLAPPPPPPPKEKPAMRERLASGQYCEAKVTGSLGTIQDGATFSIRYAAPNFISNGPHRKSSKAYTDHVYAQGDLSRNEFNIYGAVYQFENSRAESVLAKAVGHQSTAVLTCRHVN